MGYIGVVAIRRLLVGGGLGVRGRTTRRLNNNRRGWIAM